MWVIFDILDSRMQMLLLFNVLDAIKLVWLLLPGVRCGTVRAPKKSSAEKAGDLHVCLMSLACLLSLYHFSVRRSKHCPI